MSESDNDKVATAFLGRFRTARRKSPKSHGSGPATSPNRCLIHAMVTVRSQSTAGRENSHANLSVSALLFSQEWEGPELPPSPALDRSVLMAVSSSSSSSMAAFSLLVPRADADSRRRARVRSGGGKVKDGEARVIRVSDPVRDARATIYPLLSLTQSASASATPPPSLMEREQAGGGGGEDKQKYYVNMGYAIRTLREDYPALFHRAPSFDIYRDDIVFKDPLNSFSGIENYKRIFWALRFNGRIFFKTLWLDIISVWQPVENVIMVRWTVHGVPRMPWESHGRFDGTSEYKLDKEGKIYEHRVDNVAINSPPKFQVLSVEQLILSLGCPSTPKATYFKMLSSPVISSLPFLVRFTWVRYYLALHIFLTWRGTGEG